MQAHDDHLEVEAGGVSKLNVPAAHRRSGPLSSERIEEAFRYPTRAKHRLPRRSDGWKAVTVSIRTVTSEGCCGVGSRDAVSLISCSRFLEVLENGYLAVPCGSNTSLPTKLPDTKRAWASAISSSRYVPATTGETEPATAKPAS